MTRELSSWGGEAREAFAGAREPRQLATAVVRFHARVDQVLDASIEGHKVRVACTRALR